jgi:hypothetical protein
MNTVLKLVYTLPAAGVGLIIGWLCHEQVCRRKHAEEKVTELRDQLQHAGIPIDERQFKEMRKTLNDAHKHILAVSKGLQKPAR